MPRHPVLIATGGSLGVLVRWGVLDLMGHHGALTVLGLNIVGSVLIGLLAGRGLKDQPAWALGAFGFCGGLTTFSTFALDTAKYLDDGNLSRAFGLVIGTVALATVAAGVGYRLGQRSMSASPPSPWLNPEPDSQEGWNDQ